MGEWVGGGMFDQNMDHLINNKPIKNIKKQCGAGKSVNILVTVYVHSGGFPKKKMGDSDRCCLTGG